MTKNRVSSYEIQNQNQYVKSNCVIPKYIMQWRGGGGAPLHCIASSE